MCLTTGTTSVTPIAPSNHKPTRSPNSMIVRVRSPTRNHVRSGDLHPSRIGTRYRVAEPHRGKWAKWGRLESPSPNADRKHWQK